jgi:hypothetical protein
MCDVIANYYQIQMEQATAIAQKETLTTGIEDSLPLPVAQYSQKSSILSSEGKLKDICEFLSQAATTERIAGSRRVGTDMWAMNIYDQIFVQVRNQIASATKPQARAIAAELLLTALGMVWPANYQPQLKKGFLTEADLEDDVEFTTYRTPRDKMTLIRTLAYYKILK